MVAIRPILPQDRAAFAEFVRELSPESRTNRFLHPVSEFAPAFLDALTRTEPGRHLCLVAEDEGRIVAEARVVALEDGRGEFALAVADEWQRQGIGARLLRALVDAARRSGITRIEGEILRTNAAMLSFVRRTGFHLSACAGDARLAMAARTVA